MPLTIRITEDILIYVVLALVLSFFLLLSGYVVSALQSATSARSFVESVYAKQQSYHVLVSFVIKALRDEDAAVDTLLDPWTLPFEVETDRGKLTVTVYDEDRFLNLNYVESEGIYRRIFERLLLSASGLAGKGGRGAVEGLPPKEGRDGQSL